MRSNHPDVLSIDCVSLPFRTARRKTQVRRGVPMGFTLRRAAVAFCDVGRQIVMDSLHRRLNSGVQIGGGS
jgi:hypothetical protein